MLLIKNPFTGRRCYNCKLLTTGPYRGGGTLSKEERVAIKDGTVEEDRTPYQTHGFYCEREIFNFVRIPKRSSSEGKIKALRPLRDKKRFSCWVNYKGDDTIQGALWKNKERRGWLKVLVPMFVILFVTNFESIKSTAMNVATSAKFFVSSYLSENSAKDEVTVTEASSSEDSFVLGHDKDLE